MSEDSKKTWKYHLKAVTKTSKSTFEEKAFSVELPEKLTKDIVKEKAKELYPEIVGKSIVSAIDTDEPQMQLILDQRASEAWMDFFGHPTCTIQDFDEEYRNRFVGKQKSLFDRIAVKTGLDAAQPAKPDQTLTVFAYANIAVVHHLGKSFTVGEFLTPAELTALIEKIQGWLSVFTEDDAKFFNIPMNMSADQANLMLELLKMAVDG